MPATGSKPTGSSPTPTGVEPDASAIGTATEPSATLTSPSATPPGAGVEPNAARQPTTIRPSATVPLVEPKPSPRNRAGARQPTKRPGRWRRIFARAFEVMVILGATGTLVLWCSVPDTRPLVERNPASTAFIDLRRDQAEAAGKRFELKWEWRPLGKISRYLRAAVIYAEDYNFYRHDGVDWGALEDALESNLDKGSLAIGGSTITQQLAKNLYLSPDRSVLRKAREMLIAFSLEDHLSKQRILELYLNCVEWGDGVFGAEAAARRWFGHSAQALSPAEAVRLAIALPNPITRAPNVSSPALTKKAVRIIRLLRMQGLIDEGQERTALDAVGAPHEQVMPGRRPTPADPAFDKPSPSGTADPSRPSGSAAPSSSPDSSGSASGGTATEPPTTEPPREP